MKIFLLIFDFFRVQKFLIVNQLAVTIGDDQWNWFNLYAWKFARYQS